MIMKNKLFYILGLSTAVLSSCHDDEVFDTLSGTAEKTPLMVSTNINLNSSVQTRAVNKEFMEGDEFMACIRHVIVNADNNVTQVVQNGDPSADFHPTAYATFKVGENPTPTLVSDVNQYENIGATPDFSLYKLAYGSVELSTPLGLYWDDFSNSSSDATDLRTTNHKLQSFYGYCYNGAAEGSGDGQQYTLTKGDGTLAWKILTDQSSEANFIKSDLLWSLPQAPIAYTPGTSRDDQTRAGLVIPFTHAMSKVSVNVTVDENSFVASDNLFSGVQVKLLSFRSSCSLKPTANPASIDYTSAATSTPIIMHQTSKTDNSGCYEAIVVPSELIQGNTFATIVVDGNNYNIPVSANMLQIATDDNDKLGWGGKLSLSESKYQMHQGVNYVLNVKLYKTKIGVIAQIKAWDTVNANGQGDIQFTDDVTEIDITVTTNEELKSFDLWRSVYDKDNTQYRNYDENSELDGVNKATTVSITGSEDEKIYTNDPEIYWENGSTSYFFRALSKVNNEGKFVSVENSFDANQGTDLIWGTTAAHNGFSKGAAINPRTGTVPMTFEHAMSKITVKLTSDPESADAVNLNGAKISIARLYNGGKINLEDGEIKDLTAPDGNVIPLQGFLAANDNSGAEGTKLSEYVVVPQSLTKMANGTDREGTVSFYNKNELKDIEGVSYVISSLEPVCFTESEVIATNADLVGSVKIGDQLNYTESQFLDLKASEIPESLYEIFKFGENYADFIASATSPFKDLTDEDYFTIKTIIEEKSLKHNDVSAKAYNAKLPGAIHTTDVKDYKPKTDDTSVIANPGDMKPGGGTKIVMLIMLADGTSYTLDLAKCVVDGSTTPLDTWVRGNHYTYTITLKKEEITFRAMIKEWEEKTGSGNATLDWD